MNAENSKAYPCGHTAYLEGERARDRWSEDCPVCWASRPRIKVLAAEGRRVTTSHGRTETDLRFPVIRVGVLASEALGHTTDNETVMRVQGMADAALHRLGLSVDCTPAEPNGIDVGSEDVQASFWALVMLLGVEGHVEMGGPFLSRLVPGYRSMSS